MSAVLRGPVAGQWLHAQVETCALDNVDTAECLWAEPSCALDAHCAHHQVVPLARLLDPAWCQRMAPQFPQWAAFWQRVALPLLRAVE